MFHTLALLALFAAPVRADDKPKPNALTAKEIADGWIMLFDGETTFGWKIEGESTVKDGGWHLGGAKPTKAVFAAHFASYDLRIETNGSNGTGELLFVGVDGQSATGLADKPTELDIAVRVGPGQSMVVAKKFSDTGGVVRMTGEISLPGTSAVGIQMPAKSALKIKTVKLRPINTQPLFNGKDLTGWKVNGADPKRMASKWSVTKDGELAVKDGPGDLVCEKEFDNFVLQFECKTNGKALNSGIFFRCIPGQYQNGYEAQIQNAYKDDDRTKPADFGTGAIYRRIAARKVVSNDNEWFTMTVAANGKHIATWVNGYQTVDWTDDRKDDENPRKGYRAAKGPLSIQGHDPTTDILFRNIRAGARPDKE